jgi:OPA family glycerol-3-phosphate transporter-like MFS transporter
MSQTQPESFHLTKDESTSFELVAPGLQHHPPGFRARRGLNWGAIGLMYASYYFCRYNFPIANEAISKEFGFDKAQMGWIITIVSLAYACGQITNGLLTDKLGGKRAMLIGAFGTVVLNIAFGIASFWGLFALFMTIRGLDGYMQSFGAPGMIKINTAWFHRKERGRFAGIFGFMINIGRFSANWLIPTIMFGGMVFGLEHVPPHHWRWAFWVPAVITAGVACLLAFTVKETPEEAGFHRSDPDEPHAGANEPEVSVGTVLRVIASNPAVWICALAYACTGAVRQGIDQWFPRYMSEVYQVDMKSAQFQVLAWAIPIVATLGSLMSGYVSDVFFEGRRAPVAAVLYLVETIIILAAAHVTGVNGTIVMFVLIAFTANSTHSIIGTAAAMDIGGRKMAGFASGCIDSFQYFGGALAGAALGSIVERHWDNYWYFMAPFGVIGALLMLSLGLIPPAPREIRDEEPTRVAKAPAEV